ncbi:HprK-related kinase A [Marichromatium bheemlicum]|uniref:HprK-related kinase A n=1 Tax=Marichromatium bheemlicum TaxID=365339 RepID=A0ABX1I736_9GAMM|nr:HprK-related kinase A [Marichromatium bheemlicum]
MDELARQVQRPCGIDVCIGPFLVNLQLGLTALLPVLWRMWGDYPLAVPGQVRDFHVRLDHHGWLRRWWRPQARFTVDGRSPFQPLAAAHHFPMLEWGLNWCVARRAHHLLMLHAAVLERGGRALVLPGAPGAGKSTLCTALAHRGWRLLSDEFGLVAPQHGRLLPLPRPIPLKNDSIEVIRAFAPEAEIGPAFTGTRKGTVAHVRPPRAAVMRMDEPATPAWVVFPRWQAEAPTRLEPLNRSDAFLMVAGNAFNYELCGEGGFITVARLVERCRCYRLGYSDLDAALGVLGALAETEP